MTIPWLFLIVTVVGALFTASALVRGRRMGLLVVPYFFGAWLTGELAIHHIVWQAISTIAFVYYGALGAWPGWVGLGVTLLSWWGLVTLQRRAAHAPAVFDAALREVFGGDYRESVDPAMVEDLRAGVSPRHIVRPFKMRARGVEVIRNLQYGDGERRTRLDVYRPAGRRERCPVLLQVHGGGWVIGQKHQQGQPLMHRMASRGWVCVAPNYRLSPRVTFPDHLIDVKRALAWIRQHAHEHGADPNFVIVTGGSAGGHLTSLMGLTMNDPEYQPGFEHVDTSVAACVPFYGVYDFLDRRGLRGRASMTPFLERVVMKCSPTEYPERWDKASPIMRVHADAPPFFVIHGSHDSLAFIEDAREFVEKLRAVSRNRVAFAELPGAQHAFEVFHSWRSAHAIDAVCWFVEHVHAEHRASDKAPSHAAG